MNPLLLFIISNVNFPTLLIHIYCERAKFKKFIVYRFSRNEIIIYLVIILFAIIPRFK